ncbi:MAG: DUF4390 domain-containing protein [Azoarcus sp.]|nr:DUF4390 domain-containing protein [Azoarcus sp.]
MTASTTQVCAKKNGIANFLLRLLLSVVLAVFPYSAKADSATFSHVGIALSDEGYVLNANVAFDLNPKLVDALTYGVALRFVVELRIEYPRWYWFDKVIARRRLEYRLAYHAITRSYRLSIGGLHRNFDSLDDAVRTIKHIRNLPVASRGKFDDKDTYEATLRFFHDTAQLPRPFQLSVLTNKDWAIDTGRLVWAFSAKTIKQENAGSEQAGAEEDILLDAAAGIE